MRFDANVYFPQSQGGPNPDGVAAGSRFLHAALSREFQFHTIRSNPSTCAPVDNIRHLPAIIDNVRQAASDLRTLAPRTIFTQGGDCSIDVPIIDYLHGVYPGTLGVVWIDAHADVHTPQSSTSFNYHGMPVRTLLGEGHPAILYELSSPLALPQICYAGIRSIDAPEQEYIAQQQLPVLTAEAINRQDYHVVSKWLEKSNIRHLHIHFDLDALDPESDISVTYAIPGGIRLDAMEQFLRFLHGQNMTVGFTITEYAATTHKPEEISRILRLIDAVVPLCKIAAA